MVIPTPEEPENVVLLTPVLIEIEAVVGEVVFATIVVRGAPLEAGEVELVIPLVPGTVKLDEVGNDWPVLGIVKFEKLRLSPVVPGTIPLVLIGVTVPPLEPVNVTLEMLFGRDPPLGVVLRIPVDSGMEGEVIFDEPVGRDAPLDPDVVEFEIGVGA